MIYGVEFMVQYYALVKGNHVRDVTISLSLYCDWFENYRQDGYEIHKINLEIKEKVGKEEVEEKIKEMLK